MSKVLLLSYETSHDYRLVGIHSPLEDFRLAFYINSIFSISLQREKNDLDAKSGSFPFYTYNCNETFTDWAFIVNKCHLIGNNSPDADLFSTTFKTATLIQEKKQIDYFLKIEGDVNDGELSSIITKIGNIKNVITTYSINPQTLKSKDFLIF